MPELLIEFFSEEIPARMQKRAEEDFARALGEKLKAAGLEAKGVETFSGPRRVALRIADLPARTGDVSEERKGPRVGAPEKAIEGFVKSAGLASIKDAQVQADPKGDFYVARIEKKGVETAALLKSAIPDIVRAFPWPKSMRSGSADLQWVRPLHNAMVVFDGKAVAIDLPGVKSEPFTWGHRFHSKGAIKVSSFAQYQGALREARVLIDREERKRIILEGARARCAAQGLELVEDPGLLEEVAGLAEWPVVLLGDMDPAFLDLPGEVIRLSMRTHQKYFAVRDPKTKALAPHFVVVANIEAKDGGAAVAAGNARVLSARLNDARYFWDVDRFFDPIGKTKPRKLDDPARVGRLKDIVFHQKLGSVWDKVERVKALALDLCDVTKADKALVARAADLMKCDLVSETVGEFPEVQGQIGRQLAALQGEPESVCAAIEDHYRPLGPNDRVPSDPVAVTLALADKLDTLVGFWAIDEKPTGSSDAYGLRRAALGLVRILSSSQVELPLRSLVSNFFEACLENALEAARKPFEKSLEQDFIGEDRGSAELAVRYLAACLSAPILGSVLQRMMPEGVLAAGLVAAKAVRPDESLENFKSEHVEFERAYLAVELFEYYFDLLRSPDAQVYLSALPEKQRTAALRDKEIILRVIERDVTSLLAFLADRLKVQLRDQGKRHDLVDAVFALGDDDLVRVVARVEALDAFLKSDDGANLLAGYKRAANILRAEEKKNAALSTLLQKHEVDSAQLKEVEEKALKEALARVAPIAKSAVESENFGEAMRALSTLRAPVDNFLDKVLVNAPEENLRLNRLALLARIRDALHAVADFSKIEG